MPRIQTACPRCRTPLTAEVEQLFDLNTNPQAKQMLLSGQVNALHCPSCGYDGMVGTPVVYHDPEKELLLTFVPPEMGLPINEQERMIGPLINQVTNRLAPEKRKAYLLRPQTMLTFQTMIERILESDGISKQMIEDQQQRLALLQRLISISAVDSRLTVIKQEEALIDQSFFAMLSRLIEASLAQGDERSAKSLAIIQQELIENTHVGQEIKKQTEEAQAAIKSLQDASQNGLTREKLLDLFIDASDSEIKLSTLLSLARTGLDYQFYQILTDRIEKSSGLTRETLEKLRSTLLEFSKQLEEQAKLQRDNSRKLLNQLLTASDVEAIIQEHIEEIDDFFMELVDQELKSARASANLERIAQLQKINTVLEKISAPPPELAFIQELLQQQSNDERLKMMQAKSMMVTPEFVELLNNLIAQVEAQKQPDDLVNALKEINRLALRITMMAAFKGEKTV